MRAGSNQWRSRNAPHAAPYGNSSESVNTYLHRLNIRCITVCTYSSSELLNIFHVPTTAFRTASNSKFKMMKCLKANVPCDV